MGNIYKPTGNSELTNLLRNTIERTERKNISQSNKYLISKTTRGNIIRPKQSPVYTQSKTSDVKQCLILARKDCYLLCAYKTKEIFITYVPYNLFEILLSGQSIEKNPNTLDIVVDYAFGSPDDTISHIEMTVLPSYKKTDLEKNKLGYIIIGKLEGEYVVRYDQMSDGAGHYVPNPATTTIDVGHIEFSDDDIEQFRALVPSVFSKFKINKRLEHIDLNVEARQFVMTNYD